MSLPHFWNNRKRTPAFSNYPMISFHGLAFSLPRFYAMGTSEAHTMNRKELPCIDDTIALLTVASCELLLKKAKELSQRTRTRLLAVGSYPVSQNYIQDRHDRTSSELAKGL